MLARLVLIFVVAACMFSSADSRADDRDGRWWGRLAQGEKLSFVAGFFSGTDYAVLILTGASLKAMVDPKTGEFNSARAEAIKTASIGTIEKIKGDLASVTAGQIVEGLDTMYADYKNQGISVSEITYVVLYAIKGGSEAGVAHLLEVRRKQAGK